MPDVVNVESAAGDEDVPGVGSATPVVKLVGVADVLLVEFVVTPAAEATSWARYIQCLHLPN